VGLGALKSKLCKLAGHLRLIWPAARIQEAPGERSKRMHALGVRHASSHRRDALRASVDVMAAEPERNVEVEGVEA